MIDNGFLITSKDKISTQCDVLIVNKSEQSQLQITTENKYFLIEPAISVCEVKSILSRRMFATALKKLSKIKEKKEDSFVGGITRQTKSNGGFNPEIEPFDQLFTFIICEKLDFNYTELISADFFDIYAGIDYKYRHNMILSIEDGLWLYKTQGVSADFAYPYAKGQSHDSKFIHADKKNFHIAVFLTYLIHSLKNSTLICSDMAVYLSKNYLTKIS